MLVFLLRSAFVFPHFSAENNAPIHAECGTVRINPSSASHPRSGLPLTTQVPMRGRCKKCRATGRARRGTARDALGASWNLEASHGPFLLPLQSRPTTQVSCLIRRRLRRLRRLRRRRRLTAQKQLLLFPLLSLGPSDGPNICRSQIKSQEQEQPNERRPRSSDPDGQTEDRRDGGPAYAGSKRDSSFPSNPEAPFGELKFERPMTKD